MLAVYAATLILFDVEADQPIAQGRAGVDDPRGLGSVSQLRSFAQSVGRRFVKVLLLGKNLCPEPE